MPCGLPTIDCFCILNKYLTWYNCRQARGDRLGPLRTRLSVVVKSGLSECLADDKPSTTQPDFRRRHQTTRKSPPTAHAQTSASSQLQVRPTKEDLMQERRSGLTTTSGTVGGLNTSRFYDDTRQIPVTVQPADKPSLQHRFVSTYNASVSDYTPAVFLWCSSSYKLPKRFVCLAVWRVCPFSLIGFFLLSSRCGFGVIK